MSRNNKPSYAIADVAALASGPGTFVIREVPKKELMNYDLDDEDVRDWFANIADHIALGNAWFIKSRPTVKYPQGSMSDYYGAYIPGLGRAFIKFIIYKGQLIVTSFREDDDVV